MVLASGRVCDEERKKNTGKCKEENRSRVERKRNVCSFVATDNYLGGIQTLFACRTRSHGRRTYHRFKFKGKKSFSKGNFQKTALKNRRKFSKSKVP